MADPKKPPEQQVSKGGEQQSPKGAVADFRAWVEDKLEWARNNRAQQPGFLAEMRGAVRQGREDFFNNALVAFPGSSQWTREQGAPDLRHRGRLA